MCPYINSTSPKIVGGFFGTPKPPTKPKNPNKTKSPPPPRVVKGTEKTKGRECRPATISQSKSLKTLMGKHKIPIGHVIRKFQEERSAPFSLDEVSFRKTPLKGRESHPRNPPYRLGQRKEKNSPVFFLCNQKVLKTENAN